jgi:hypothetical protein
MPFTALLYKEFRQQISIWIVLFVCAVLMQGLTSLTFALKYQMSSDMLISALIGLAWVLVTVYAYGSAGSIFVAEHEEKTYGFLRGLPIRRGTLLAAKLAWVLLGTLSFALCLAVTTFAWTMFACVVLFLRVDFQKGIANFSSIDGGYSLAILFCNTILAAIVWGLFWSARSRHQLFALLATFVCAAATAAVCKRFLGSTDYELAALVGVECLVLGFALYRAYFWYDRWVDRKQRHHRAGDVSPGPVAQQPGLTPPALWQNSFIALTWHAVRQSSRLFAFATCPRISVTTSRT